MSSFAARSGVLPRVAKPASAPLTPRSTRQNSVAALQRTMGNRALLQLLRSRPGAFRSLLRQPVPGAPQQQKDAPKTPPPEVVLDPVFITDAKPTDQKFALRTGKEDAQAIRAKRVLSPELRSELNAKLAFFEGDAHTVYADTIKPALESLGGGAADIGNIDTELSSLLKNFTSAAHDGVNLFATKVLSGRLDDIESGSMKTFLLGILGNGIWAATVFLPVSNLIEQAVVFSVAASGIGIAAAPGAPSASVDPLPEIEKYMYAYFDAYEADVKKMALARAAILIQNTPSARVDDITQTLTSEFFRKEHYRTDTIGKIEVDSGKIRDEVASRAEDRWVRFKAQVIPIGKHSYVPTPPNPYGGGTGGGTFFRTELAWVVGPTGTYLTRVGSSEVVAPFLDKTFLQFESFIDQDLREPALGRAAAAQPAGIPTLAASDVPGFPIIVPPTAAKK